jgi:mono/diheme cytochrome c family protein
VVTFVNDGKAALTDSLFDCTPSSAHIPPTLLPGLASASSVPMQDPTAVVLDPTGSWLYVANRAGNNIALISTSGAATGPMPAILPISVGAGPTGIALSHSGTRAYVYNSFDHTLTVLGPVPSGGIQRIGADLPLATDTLSADVVAGRELFFSAVDPRMTSASTAIACASCHLEGREDGHVWQFTEGPRRTPSLAGRDITSTAPFHWSGELANFSDFMNETVINRMGGTGPDATTLAQLSAYIDSLAPPDNPNHLAQPTAAQQRGALLFQSAGCAACHSGTTFTNNGFANVGTLVTGGSNPDDPTSVPNGFNVPSLLSLARCGPYLHDGSAPTFLARLQDNAASNLHGQTSGLSYDQMSDLAAYLQSL